MEGRKNLVRCAPVERKAVVQLCAAACGGNVARMSARGQEPGEGSRAEAKRVAGGGAGTGTSGALLSELFGGTEGERVQVELSAMRILFARCGYLLSGMVFHTGEAST